jgi:hypothetical protein
MGYLCRMGPLWKGNRALSGPSAPWEARYAKVALASLAGKPVSELDELGDLLLPRNETLRRLYTIPY